MIEHVSIVCENVTNEASRIVDNSNNIFDRTG
jgi:hypothetical protein